MISINIALEGVNYKETAETVEEAAIAVIPKEDFETLMHVNTAITRKFVGLLGNNISQKEDQLLAMAYYSLRKKVANTLVMLHHKYRSSPGTGPPGASPGIFSGSSSGIIGSSGG